MLPDGDWSTLDIRVNNLYLKRLHLLLSPVVKIKKSVYELA